MPERILEVGSNTRRVIKISQAVAALTYLRDEISDGVASTTVITYIDRALEAMNQERENAIIARAA